MNIISIDVGMKNLAFCVFAVVYSRRRTPMCGPCARRGGMPCALLVFEPLVLPFAQEGGRTPMLGPCARISSLALGSSPNLRYHCFIYDARSLTYDHHTFFFITVDARHLLQRRLLTTS